MSLVDTQRAIGLRGSLIDFVRMAWHIVEPTSVFVESWHIEEVCNHLEATYDGRIRDLVINIPPGHMKSLLTCVFFPTWCWLRDPGLRFIYASFDPGLTLRDARKQLAIIGSQWFKDRWGDRVTVVDGVAASDFSNSQAGFRFSTSIMGKAIGRHGDFLIVDDPIKPTNVSKDALRKAIEWWQGTMASRLRSPTTARKIVIMQRIHEDDLAGFCVREGSYEHLRLPARYEEVAPCVTSVGGDRRRIDGELLWPAHMPEVALAKQEASMGSRVSAAQLQQRPSPEGGAIFQRAWFKQWVNLPGHLFRCISVDCTYKDTDGTDYVVIQVWGKNGPDYYLLDELRERMDFPTTCNAILSVKRRHPRATAILIEDKANGPAVITTLKKKVAGLIAVEPMGSKLARAAAVSPFFESGNVFHPPPEACPWIDDHQEELVGFPTGRYDDRVDATSQALIYLHAKGSNLIAAMKNLTASKMRALVGG